MIRVGIAIFVVFATLLPGGCSGEAMPIWEETKITDLHASGSDNESPKNVIKPMNFDVYILEIPAENMNVFNDLWPVLNHNRIKFSSYSAFMWNSFSVGSGKQEMWGQVSALLAKAGVKKKETVSMVLLDSQVDELALIRIHNAKTVYYVTSSGLTQAAVVGPGTMNLRITAEKIPGSRGVCKVKVEPVFLTSMSVKSGKSTLYEETGRFAFKSCRFELSKVSPGDFFVLGPNKDVSNEGTLAGMVFARQTDKPVNKAFIFICRNIVD